MGLDDFLKDARGECELDSKGSFSLSRAKALEKLADFQFESEGHFLLRILQAAYLNQACEVKVKLGSRIDSVSWSGAPNQVDAQSLADALFRTEEASNPIAAHLISAFRANLKHSWEWRLGVHHFLRWDGRELEVETGPAELEGPIFEVHHSSFLNSFLNGRQRAEKAICLEEHSFFSGFRLSLDSRVLPMTWPELRTSGSEWFAYYAIPYYLLEAYFPVSSELPRLACPAAALGPTFDQFAQSDYQIFRNRRFEANEYGFYEKGDDSLFKAYSQVEPGEPIGCAMTVGNNLNKPGEIRFLLDGILSQPKTLSKEFPSVQLVVSGEGLNTDLTGLQVVENESFHQRIKATQEHLPLLLRILWEHKEHYQLNLSRRGSLVFNANDARINGYPKDFHNGICRRLPKP